MLVYGEAFMETPHMIKSQGLYARGFTVMSSCHGWSTFLAEECTISMKPDRFGNGANARLCTFCFSSVFEEAYEATNSETQLLFMARVVHSAVRAAAKEDSGYSECMYSHCLHRFMLVPNSAKSRVKYQ